MSEIRIENLIAKAGGPYHLVTLFQKRMRELQRGAVVLVDPTGKSYQEIVGEEIVQGRIWLVSREEDAALREERAREALEMAEEAKEAKESAGSG